jgi:hypothetical protein
MKKCKSKGLNFGVHFKSPMCPYMQMSCVKFRFDLARGICNDGVVRCSWLPSWISGSKRFAVLSGEILHV